jgi:hypothetical protein
MADAVFDIVKLGLAAAAGSLATLAYNRLKAEKATANQCRDKLDSLCTLAEKAFRYREAGVPDLTIEMDALVERTDLGILVTRQFGKHQDFHKITDAMDRLDFALEAIDPPAPDEPPRVSAEAIARLRDAQRTVRSAIYGCFRDTMWKKALGGHQLQP